jgi:ribose-phosphate pyrophosphokinase
MRGVNKNSFLIFSGNSNLPLAQSVCDILDMELGSASVNKFSDKETRVQILKNVRKKDTFVIQSTCEPANDYYMELFIMLDALKRASANSITVVMPYFGYARQDRKADPRTPITAKLMADLLQVAGANRIITIDLHANQIQGFFNIPVDNVYARVAYLEFLKEKFSDDLSKLIIVSPDAGGVPRARSYAEKLKINYAIIDKKRERANLSEVMHVIGDVKGKIALIADDLIDTAGTVTKGAQALLNAGAEKVYVVTTHGVLSGPAIDRINKSVIERVWIMDTIPLGPKASCKKIELLSIAPLLAEVIKRCHIGESIADVF